MTSAELLLELERVAEKRHDGRFTIMRLATNWRVMFGTPYGCDDIARAFAGLTFADAAEAALRKEQIETRVITRAPARH